jgi:hypothetical protein
MKRERYICDGLVLSGWQGPVEKLPLTDAVDEVLSLDELLAQFGE